MLKSLPALFALLKGIQDRAEAEINKGIGYDQAVNTALLNASREITLARQTEVEAEKIHATKPDSDDAFIDEFRRR